MLKEFLNLLKKKEAMIYYHLFSLLDKDKLENLLKEAKESPNFDNWFLDFHKSIRQTDFYNIGEGHLDMVLWLYIHESKNELSDLIKGFIK